MSNPIKIVILGNAGVGKTSLINQYVNGAHDHEGTGGGQEPTTTQQKYLKEVVKGGTTYNVEIWDTNGQEKYMSLGAGFFKNASAIGFVYSLTDPLSFDNGLEMWHFEFISQSGEDPSGGLPIMVMANKSDLETETEADPAKWGQDMQDWREGNVNSNSPFHTYKTSAVKGTSVNTCMDKLVDEAILMAIQRNPKIYAPTLEPAPAPDDKKRCILL